MPLTRHAWLALAAPVACIACDRRATAASSDAGTSAPAPVAASGITCKTDPSFPATLQVAEAAAAAEVELIPGNREILVVSDSGRGGAALLVRVPSGPTRAITLPLDPAASDDVEGMAWVTAHADGGGGALYTLTSSGAVRRFVPDGKGGLRRDQDAYPLGASPAACPNLRDVNCGRNYEGLCLRSRTTPARCAGYAASRASAELECLVFDGDRLVADDLRPPMRLGRGLVPAGSLSDCAFGAAAGPATTTLLVTTNVYGGSATYVVTEPSGTLTLLDGLGTLNNEGVAVDREGAAYLFGDIDSELSPAMRAICKGW
jgi:hypothetical protein